MKIGITGTPGVGKTSVSKIIAENYQSPCLNEKQFALKKEIGEFDTEENELIVPLPKLEQKLNDLLKKEKKIVVEGHLICEIKAKFDYLILITCDPELLELRLDSRGYKAEKIQDNVFCEGIDYCKKHASRNYPKEKIIEIRSRKTIKETSDAIITEINKREHL